MRRRDFSHWALGLVGLSTLDRRDEPMIAIYGEFGIRLEDCLYITESGPRFFTGPARARDHLFA